MRKVKCQNTTIPISSPSWPEEWLVTKEHCQGLTAREGEAHPGQAHEGTHNLSTKGEAIGAAVNQLCPVPTLQYMVSPNKKEIMNSNLSQSAQRTMVKYRGYFFVKYKTNSLDQTRFQYSPRGSPGAKTID
jgi:hypothetical protein